MAGVCKLCGTPHEDGAKFCTECGAVLISRVGEDTTAADAVKVENTVNENNVENVENTENSFPKTDEGFPKTVDSGVSNTYGAENAENPTAYTNTQSGNTGNPYGGANYNAPNGGNPYGGANYNAPNGGNPYGGGNYNTPNGGTPYGGGNYNAPNGGTPYGGGNYNAPNGSNPYGGAPQMQPPRGFNIGALVFSIINLILGCCSCTGFIFGGAGLAFAIMAKNSKLDEESSRYNKVSIILNVIGVITTILVFVAAFAIGFMEGFETIE